MRRVPTDPDPTDPQDDSTAREQQATRQGIAYRGASEAVASIMVGGALGYFADQYFDTSPFLLLIGFVFGFSAFFVRLLRLKRLLEANERSRD
ncbi:MAG: AtpZ/AtpI family protein [Steroidobacteraceae bacterium]